MIQSAWVVVCGESSGLNGMTPLGIRKPPGEMVATREKREELDDGDTGQAIER